MREGPHNTASKNELRDLRHRFGLSQALLARLLDVSLRTLSGAESASTLPPQMRRSVTQASRLCDALAEAMQPTFVGPWLEKAQRNARQPQAHRSHRTRADRSGLAGRGGAAVGGAALRLYHSSQ